MVVSQPVLCVVFFGLFFFPLSQVMTGTIWTDFCSTIFVFFCVQSCLRQTLRTDKWLATYSVHSCVSVLCKQSSAKSLNSGIGSSSFRQDLFLLNKFDNSLAYSLLKEIHSAKPRVSMVVFWEGLTWLHHWKFFFLTFANVKYPQGYLWRYQLTSSVLISSRSCCCGTILLKTCWKAKLLFIYGLICIQFVSFSGI